MKIYFTPIMGEEIFIFEMNNCLGLTLDVCLISKKQHMKESKW